LLLVAQVEGLYLRVVIVFKLVRISERLLLEVAHDIQEGVVFVVLHGGVLVECILNHKQGTQSLSLEDIASSGREPALHGVVQYEQVMVVVCPSEEDYILILYLELLDSLYSQVVRRPLLRRSPRVFKGFWQLPMLHYSVHRHARINKIWSYSSS